MKSGKIAVFGLILTATLVSAVAARAEISIGGGIEGYIPSARPQLIILPAAQPAAAVKAAPVLQKAGQAAPAAAAGSQPVSVEKVADKKTAEVKAVKPEKKAEAPSAKPQLAAGTVTAPKVAAPVSAS